ncbi:MAG: cbb3-type cytochrome c oxidase subunit II [Opitutales bacterium]
MKNGFVLFLGIFLTLALSWLVLPMTNHIGYGDLDPHADDITGREYPGSLAGVAQRGMRVYAELGCDACHSQQERRAGFGADQERGWGERLSVARDYIHHDRVMLGHMRTGPDLKNIGDRQADKRWHHRHLYDPRSVIEGSTMPPFAFLYDKKKIVGDRSPDALDIPVEEGYEIVPGKRARDLVSYLLALKTDHEFDLPEVLDIKEDSEDE